MPPILSRRQILAFSPITMAVALLCGCAHNPAFVTQENAPADLRTGKAYVALDVHEYVDGLFPTRVYSTVATFTNVALGKAGPYFPADQWALLSTTNAHHPEHILAVEAGTYRLTWLGIAKAPTTFGIDASPVEFTVRPGEVVYLGALEWHRDRTSSILEFHPRYNFTFAVTDDFAKRQASLERAMALLPGNPQMRTRLMTVRTASVEMQGHRPSLW